MTHAYSQMYLGDASYILGHMLHSAVNDYHIEGGDMLHRFIQTSIAEEFGCGNPKYVAGTSGAELCMDIIYLTTGQYPPCISTPSYGRSRDFWIGWILAHYQWYSGHSFRSILERVSYEDFACLYSTLHEADVQKSYEILDRRMAEKEINIKQG